MEALYSCCFAGATLVDPFNIRGNSLGAHDWDGRSSQWYTGSADSGHWEDINCGAHFKSDMNSYLSTAGTKYKSVQVRSQTRNDGHLETAHWHRLFTLQQCLS